MLVSRNRMSFVKKYIFKNDESFETAINILRNKVTRILHLRNDRVPALGKIANYALESTDIVETKDTTGWYKAKE